MIMKQEWYREPNIMPSDKRFPWIGLHLMFSSSWNETENIRWVDDSAFSYQNWAAHEPNSMVMVP